MKVRPPTLRLGARRRRGRLALTAVAAAAGLVLAACGGDAASDDPAGAVGGGTADPNATVVVGLVLEPSTLDITTGSGVAIAQVLLNNVYQGLLERDDEGNITPKLASEYKLSDDGLTYTFTLRDGVTFHDGTPLTASDVVASLSKVIAPGSTNPNAGDFASLESVTSPDPKTVVLKLKSRDANFTFWLTGPAGAVLKDGATDLAETAVGTGPFTFDSWKHGDSITLVRNDSYWGDQAGVAEVVFRYITDVNAQNNAVKTGQVDIGAILDSDLLDAYEGDPNFTIVKGSTTDKFTLGFNNAKAPLSDERVRHAIRQGIDKDGLLKTFGQGIRIGSDVPPLDPWYEDLTSIDKYNPENAKKLLADAGFASGLDLTLTVPNIYPSTISEYIVSQLEEIGVNVTIRSVEFPTWLTDVFTNHDYDLSLVDHAEPRDLGNYAKTNYYWGYNDPEAQRLYQAAVTATTDAERDTNFKALARLVSEKAVSDWLLLGESIQVARTGISGYPENNTSSRFDASKIVVTL
ncbi:ABC transporter substrate-binding protein [Frankia sp. CNm7]|uniref:ABC transporter substrate-binding protein n=1 Tax=Frankia nepalensis TaxID=1836974 RepID=A0A937RL46_9ACTN|nr:ABC transporter substrate-binding protein [Frankia nepalensis]MBL7498486.1 ABC transporter substrate-binding protein [Frankia nepalensis]MBL7509508.1 ABC transporter substrate-binding protein [Frankia nepalensis]MBL7518253.1 ABC transporter substrate-binding protein [Frankia nepalensis]MBL7629319.1 ABC transporter substrate-binding protein [Frankia nepalensis]